MDYVDKLTLELLINKSQYQRYLSKADPEKYKIRQDHLDNIQKYKSEIKEMTSDLLDNVQITTEINDAFESYIQILISHLQMKEHEDDDTLFANIPPTHTDSLKNSFWGKIIKKEE